MAAKIEKEENNIRHLLEIDPKNGEEEKKKLDVTLNKLIITFTNKTYHFFDTDQLLVILNGLTKNEVFFRISTPTNGIFIQKDLSLATEK